MIALTDVAHPWEARGDIGCVIGRSVIDQDHFILGIIKFAKRIETGRKRLAAVVRANNYRDERRARQRTKRQSGVVLPELFPKRVKRFLRLPLPGYNPKAQTRDSLTAGKPFVRPGKENRSGKTALHHAIDVPTEHFGLFLLRMPEGVHAEFAKNQRPFFRQILQPQQVALKIRLIVQVNVETAKVDVLGKEIFGWRISRVGKKRGRIKRPPDPHQFLHKFHYAARPEPAHHGAGDLVSHEITENRRVTRIGIYCDANSLCDFMACSSLPQKLDMLRPWQCDERTHAGSGATIEKPSRGDMIDPHDVEAGLAHQRQVGFNLSLPSEIISVCVRLEWSVGNPLNEKFFVALEKEFRDSANP